MMFASTILMIRPAAFGYNEQTAVNNSFQQNTSFENLQHKVLEEFDDMVAAIRSAGIEVMVVDDTPDPPKPDAVFPNNWFCTMPDGSLSIFPMNAANRRIERREDLVEQLASIYNLSALHDWTTNEHLDVFLEGTGSMVMDHQTKTVYACISDRTNTALLEAFAESFSYKTFAFKATDRKGFPIYHTNVMMCIGSGFIVLCEEVIDNAAIEQVKAAMAYSGKEIISISYDQMKQFAGNMLQLKGGDGELYLVMSRSAFDSLSLQQKEALNKYTQLLPVNITTIETIGGGSARCMMAEIFVERADPI